MNGSVALARALEAITRAEGHACSSFEEEVIEALDYLHDAIKEISEAQQ